MRHHDDLARIEIAREELSRALEPETRAAIVIELKALGYRYVTIDLQGYRMGSLNEGLLLTPAFITPRREDDAPAMPTRDLT